MIKLHNETLIEKTHSMFLEADELESQEKLDVDRFFRMLN